MEFLGAGIDGRSMPQASHMRYVVGFMQVQISQLQRLGSFGGGGESESEERSIVGGAALGRAADISGGVGFRGRGLRFDGFEEESLGVSESEAWG